MSFVSINHCNFFLHLKITFKEFVVSSLFFELVRKPYIMWLCISLRYIRETDIKASIGLDRIRGGASPCDTLEKQISKPVD